MQKVAIVGLGRFGMALARQLGASGADVMAIDRSTQLVNEIKDEVAAAVRLDSTDETALAAQELDKFDVCVVAIGENFEAALLTTVIAKKLGVAKVICRAQTQFHAEIFRQIGADEVIQPETQAGEELARKLANPHLEDFISFAEGYAIIELRAPAVFQGKSLQTLGLRRQYGVNLLAIKRMVAIRKNGEVVEQQRTLGVPAPEDVIESGDLLVLVGPDEALSRLPRG